MPNENTVRVIKVANQDDNDGHSSHGSIIEQNDESARNNEKEEVNADENEHDNEETPIENNDQEDSSDVINESEVPVPRARRFSLGKIPVPPMPMTIEDIQEAARNAEMLPIDVRPLAEPRRSSVNLDVYKNFRESKSKKAQPNKNQMVHVETKGKFRSMKKGTFQIERMMEKERQDELDKQRSFVAPARYHDIAYAFHAQKNFNQFANIIQGFLAGISVTLAVFSFNFSWDVLIRGYRWMSLPVHAAFLAAFSVGLTTAIDRTGLFKTQHFSSRTHFKEVIMNNGLLGILLWSGGLLSSLLCIQFDAGLALKPNIPPTQQQIIIWRGYSVVRAVCASVGWLLLAFNSNADTVAFQLKTALLDSIKLEALKNKTDSTNIAERRELIIKALNM